MEMGIPSISLWTGTPHYLPTANPKAWRAVLDRLLPILGIDLDLQDLHRREDRLNKQVEQALSQNPKLQRYVRQLENALEVKEEDDSFQSEDIIKSLEDFLRQHQQGGPED